jgi:hypothetical protein
LHSEPSVQATPFAFLPQLVPAQVFGATQSASAEQTVLQVLFVLHWKGSHSDEVTVLHVPAPSQVRAGMNVELAQVAATHTVPAA